MSVGIIPAAFAKRWHAFAKNRGKYLVRQARHRGCLIRESLDSHIYMAFRRAYVLELAQKLDFCLSESFRLAFELFESAFRVRSEVHISLGRYKLWQYIEE